jgi:acyl-coenzyme A synthetase/AMP-(fatty) acid ligase
LWRLYPYLGDSSLFVLLKSFYEKVYGPMVQVTQTYGATELICNAIANTALTGPDMRGVGSAFNTIHPEIIDDDGFVLPHDGKTIGRLRFYGSSIASGYLDNDESSLSLHCYKTSDLASIDQSGRVNFFGRSENVISLPGVSHKINPFLLERKLNKIKHVKLSIIFRLEDKLHAAILVNEMVNKSRLIEELIRNHDFILVATISIWSKFPMTLGLGGKIDKKAIFNSIVKNEIPTLKVNNKQEQMLDHSDQNWCLIS